MVALGIGIGNMSLTHPQHFFHHGSIAECGLAQLNPIPALATSDHIVDGRQGKLLMGQMSV